MERKLGTLSYDPKTLIPMYSGEGPNRFWDFMQSKIRQNIVSACYNDALTPQQISLETGISLSYLDDEIKALADKKILIADGPRYKTNVIVITADCRREIDIASESYCRRLADEMAAYVDANMSAYKEIGFRGADYSDTTLRWQLIIPVFREIMHHDAALEAACPVTGWGERACLRFEDASAYGQVQYVFNYSTLGSDRGDLVMFYDYLPRPYGVHHDFYGNRRYVNILCDIARGDCDKFGEYDLEAVAEMIRMGYVRKDGESFAVNMPVYTAQQYARVQEMARAFVTETVGQTVSELLAATTAVLREHTPKHLQNQVELVAYVEKHFNAVSMPVLRMIEEGKLVPNWHMGEMPTTYVVLSE